MGEDIMNIAITGASGFIGRFLSSRLERQGHQIFPVGRSLLLKENKNELAKLLSNCDAVINLAGTPIRTRWTKDKKRLILESRTSVTQSIVETINGLARKPSNFISASAVGIYPSEDMVAFDEESIRQGTGFLSDVCRSWEKEAMKISRDVRCVVTRFGVVLDPSGGAFPTMIAPLKFGISAIIGRGDQPLAWISLNDLARAFEFILLNASIRGIVNLTAPSRTTSGSFADETASRRHPWITLRIPSWLLKLTMGESASVILTGQWVIPRKLLDAGFIFSDPDMRSYLDNINPVSSTS